MLEIIQWFSARARVSADRLC